MRKKIIITVLSIFLSTILNGCVSTSHTVSEITDADAISQSLTNTNASMQTGPLTLTVTGENKLLVTLTDDRMNGFLEFDEGSTNQMTFNVNFFAKNQQKLSISMTPYNWDLTGSEDLSKGGVPDFYVNGQKETYQVAGNTLSFEVNQTGIADYLSKCDNYTLYYFDKNNQQEMLAGGFLSDIVSNQKSNEIIKITYMDDNQVIVRLGGETFDRYLNGEGYHNLTLGFYLPGNDSNIPLYELRMSSGEDSFESKLYQLTLKKSEGIMDSEELIGDQYNNSLRTDSGYSTQIFYGGIESLLSACDRIVVTDDEGKTLLTESYQNAVTNGEAVVSAIPEVFEVNAKDDDYFYPATEDYIVIMLDMPMATILDYGYGTVDGIEYYAPINAHEAPLKFISVISYNEFGIADQRTKIIYDSVASSVSASADRLDWYPVSQLTGDEATDKNILMNFMESLDQNIFGSPVNANEKEAYQYFGHYDNVRYFDAAMDQIKVLYNSPPDLSYDLNAAFGSDGFCRETLEYKYDFPNFARNISEMRQSTATVTVYSSKAAGR